MASNSPGSRASTLGKRSNKIGARFESAIAPVMPRNLTHIAKKAPQNIAPRTNPIVVVTHSPHLHLDSTYATLNLIKEHRHGDSCIAVYQKESKP